MKELIEQMLADGKIIERKTLPEQGCKSCAFKSECKGKYEMPCMAHNRKDKRSIYYTLKK